MTIVGLAVALLVLLMERNTDRPRYKGNRGRFARLLAGVRCERHTERLGMRTARLAARLRRLEAVAGDGGPHAHPLRLLVLGDGRPSEAWCADRALCSGCTAPGLMRIVVWPPEEWELP